MDALLALISPGLAAVNQQMSTSCAVAQTDVQRQACLNLQTMYGQRKSEALTRLAVLGVGVGIGAWFLVRRLRR